ncbi:hypothetical protein CDAR_275821 [Caerostris darwini]|uniref:Uncharacterized protein n=1 Tax=Caerostris darwini TaxID=1538125 RepID=A0AAV4RQ46_9ARAC|nr:hypothetical protein CDAR_275821 [Caerostris darwini]
MTKKGPLLEERKALDAELNATENNQIRQKLSKVNAEIKIMYAQIKRSKWKDLCSSLDPGSSNGELWRLVKSNHRWKSVTQLRVMMGKSARMILKLLTYLVHIIRVSASWTSPGKTVI